MKQNESDLKLKGQFIFLEQQPARHIRLISTTWWCSSILEFDAVLRNRFRNDILLRIQRTELKHPTQIPPLISLIHQILISVVFFKTTTLCFFWPENFGDSYKNQRQIRDSIPFVLSEFLSLTALALLAILCTAQPLEQGKASSSKSVATSLISTATMWTETQKKNNIQPFNKQKYI